MPVNLTITCDTAAELVDEFRKINTLTTTSQGPVGTLTDVPLDALIDMVRIRLDGQGFRMDIVDKNSSPVAAPNASVPEPAPPTPPTPEPAPEPKAKKARKSDLDVLSNPDADITAPRRSKTNGTDPMDTLKELADQPADEGDPEGDRTYVLDVLAGWLKDPKRKTKVLEFTSTQAKLHGAEKISALPAEPFPSIRREMEKAFPDVRLA